MNGELTRRVRAAAPDIVFPPVPDLADAVLARLDPEPERWPRRSRSIVLALACAAAACVAVLGMSERARSAIVEAFDLVPGVEITRTHVLPARTTLLGSPTDFGRPLALDEARRRAGFLLRLPGSLPQPETVYYDHRTSGTSVTAVYGLASRGASLVFTQWHPARLLFRKLVRSPDTLVLPVRVEDVRGLWIVGDEHEVFYTGKDRLPRRGAPWLAGAALVWHRDSVSYRLEGDLSLETALAFVRSLE